MTNLVFNENSILVDSQRKGITTTFWDNNEYTIFKKNQKKVDPVYLERDIEYCFNSQGYRTKEIKNLDKEFVLVFGCSHTEGVGNFEEDIWCSQLLTNKGIDFLNLGKAGSGPDIQYLNTLQWIKNNYPLPVLVIYQWPQTFRKSFSYKKREKIFLKHHNVNNSIEKKDTEWYLKRYCVEEGEMTVNNYKDYASSNLLWNLIDVPVLNWTWQGDFETDYDNLNIIETEDTGRARDLMHDGPDIHRQVADKLTPIIDKLL